MTAVIRRTCASDVDLFRVAGTNGWVFVRDGVGVAGRGLMRNVHPSAAVQTLAELNEFAIAIGARPFDPEAPWVMTIPAFQVRIEPDGTATEIMIGTQGEQAREEFAQESAAIDAGIGHDVLPNIGALRITPSETAQDWMRTVTNITTRINQGEAEKVVLARQVTAIAENSINSQTILHRLRDRFGTCYLYHVNGVLGASPELLVERRGLNVMSQPMAGTTRHDDARGDDSRNQALFESATYRHEHQVTIDMVHDTLLSFASFIDYEPEPSLVTLDNVTHLATQVSGELSAPPATALELQDALHPTPAVSGRPRENAISMIGELETFDRGLYAGTVGWVDGTGDGTWAVTIRCAQIDSQDSRQAVITAGCGLVSTSTPEDEYAESQAKLQALLGALED